MNRCPRNKRTVILITICLTAFAFIVLLNDNNYNANKRYGKRRVWWKNPVVVDMLQESPGAKADNRPLQRAVQKELQESPGAKADNRPLQRAVQKELQESPGAKVDNRPLQRAVQKEKLVQTGKLKNKAFTSAITAAANTQQTMARRSSHLHDVCSRLQNKPLKQRQYDDSHLEHLIVDDNKQILYCYIPKIACTNFKRVFLGLAGVVNMTDISELSGYEVHNVYLNSLKLLRLDNKSKQNHILKTYKKFMIVREPFERLVSAYRNKFFHPNPVNRKTFLDMIQSFYDRQAHLKVKLDQDASRFTFTEFVQFLVDAATDLWLNDHYVPYWNLCHPCDVHYDYIGKYETLTEDTNHIFSELSIDVKFPERNDNYSSDTTNSVVDKYFKQVPNGLRRQLWELLKTDYQLFDYPVPEELKFDNDP